MGEETGKGLGRYADPGGVVGICIGSLCFMSVDSYSTQGVRVDRVAMTITLLEGITQDGDGRWESGTINQQGP